MAFDMSHDGAGLCSRHVMGSARKGDALTCGQTLVLGSTQSSRPTASPQTPNRDRGSQDPALGPAGAGDTTLCPSTCSQSRDQQCWQAGTGQGQGRDRVGAITNFHIITSYETTALFPPAQGETTPPRETSSHTRLNPDQNDHVLNPGSSFFFYPFYLLVL